MSFEEDLSRIVGWKHLENPPTQGDEVFDLGRDVGARNDDGGRRTHGPTVAIGEARLRIGLCES